MGKSHGYKRANRGIVAILEQRENREEAKLIVNVKQMSVGDSVLHGVHAVVIVAEKLIEHLTVFFIARHVLCGLKEREYLKRVCALFINPLMIAVKVMRIPVSPCCGFAVYINKAEVVIQNMIHYFSVIAGRTRSSFPACSCKRTCKNLLTQFEKNDNINCSRKLLQYVDFMVSKELFLCLQKESRSDLPLC